MSFTWVSHYISAGCSYEREHTNRPSKKGPRSEQMNPAPPVTNAHRTDPGTLNASRYEYSNRELPAFVAHA